MYNELRTYLTSITSEEETSCLIGYLSNLEDIYGPAVIQSVIINYLAQVNDIDSFGAKSELYVNIIELQISFINKCGIATNDVDVYAISALDGLVEMIGSLEVFEERLAIEEILVSSEDTSFAIAEIAQYVTGRNTIPEYLNVIASVDDKFIDVVTDYITDAPLDIIDETPLPNERIAALRQLLNENPFSYHAVRNYITEGNQINVSLYHLLSALTDEFGDMSTDEILENITAIWIIASQETSYIDDLTRWANEALLDRPDTHAKVLQLKLEENRHG